MPSPILVSACLLGRPVRYDGASRPCSHPALARWQAQGRLVAFCPEEAGGLPTPRPAAEIVAGKNAATAGAAVLEGAVRVLTRAGDDVTSQFIAGAEAALALVRARGIRIAILKEGSPSCGSAEIHDGTFAGRRVAGSGVTAALLARAGVQVFSEARLDAAAAWLADREGD